MNDERYLELLAEKYPTEQAVSREIINLTAILSLPKGTEHFMSDLHGEYEAFCHILNNCSGVIREKVDLLFGETLSDFDREEICTLIYYPVEKLELVRKEGKNNEEWYRATLGKLIDIARIKIHCRKCLFFNCMFSSINFYCLLFHIYFVKKQFVCHIVIRIS